METGKMADILVVDDTPSVRTALSILLEEEGHAVDFASDGDEALERYERKRPDLLLLDIMMPKKNGYQVLKRIRRSDSALPVIFLTAKGSPADISLGLDLGADDYLPKPFDDEVLVSRVNAVLRRSRLSASSDAERVQGGIFAFGSRKVDVKRHLLISPETEDMPLSVREMGMLRMFAEHPGEVLSRDTLLDGFWHLGTKVTTRVLDQAINVLRRKLGDDAMLIETVHGAGYRYRIS
jgi:DNA-binding response OmpR family regulator